MFNRMRVAALAAVSMGVIACTVPLSGMADTVGLFAVDERPSKRVRYLAASSKRTLYRSRGPQAKPARKSNRLTLSKRVRRQHRRAA